MLLQVNTPKHNNKSVMLEKIEDLLRRLPVVVGKALAFRKKKQ